MGAVAAHKGIVLEKLEARVETHIDESGGQQKTTFVTTIDLGLGLSERERRILFNSARHCEVHRLLSGLLDFKETLVSDQEIRD